MHIPFQVKDAYIQKVKLYVIERGGIINAGKQQTQK